MHLHDNKEKNREKAEYRMAIIQKYKSSFQRQCNEPMRIKIAKKSKHITNINSKTEWNSQCIDRLRAIPVGGEYNNDNIINIQNTSIVPIQSQNQNIRKAGRPKGCLNKKTITRNNATSQNQIINLSAHNNENETANNV